MEIMTVEQTIQSLYQDIAAIKEHICKVDEVIDFLSFAGGSVQAQSYTIPINVRKIVVYSFATFPLSRIFDRYDSNLDEYTYEALGTVTQLEYRGSNHWAHPSHKLEFPYMIFDRKKGADRFHARPKIGVEVYVLYYGIV